jgi:hypothetical protein
MFEWPEDEKPIYEAVLDPSKYGRYEKGRIPQRQVIQGWIVQPPKGFPAKSRWVIDLEWGPSRGCGCGEESDEEDDDDAEDQVLPVFVPSGFKRKQVSVEYLKNKLPLSAETLEKLKAKGAVEAARVVYKSARPWYLTKGELMAIPPDKPVRAFLFDRNWGDRALNHPRGRAFPLKQFFADTSGTLTRNESGTKLTLEWPGEGSFELDTEIMYAAGSWYPMRDGVLGTSSTRTRA